MRFADVQHQRRAMSLLARALRSGRRHHAYLFVGPDGVGKELAARALAARLLCEASSPEADADACGVCRSCRLFESGGHPDFHLIHSGLHKLHPERSIRESKGLFLVVDVIRHFLIEPSSRSPNLGRQRVFVIRDAERMNEGAQNALLKTLEEPPGEACLILTSASEARLLPTIRSRCQRIAFDLLPSEFVRQKLIELDSVPQERARLLAGLAEGRLGAALQWHRIDLPAALAAVVRTLDEGLAEDPESFAAALVETATALAGRVREQAAPPPEPDDEKPKRKKPARAAASSNVSTSEQRAALKLVLMLCSTVFRDALARAAGCERLELLTDHADAIKRLDSSTSVENATRAIEGIAEAERMLDRNVAPQLTCERLATVLCGDVRAC